VTTGDFEPEDECDGGEEGCYDDGLCPDCCEEPCRCYEADQTCDLCGTPGCPGYCDDYQTYNLRPAETGGSDA
jgi:hypothetical protein